MYKHRSSRQHGVSSSQEFQNKRNTSTPYMAPRRRLLRGNSVLVSVYARQVGYLVFRFDVKRLFSDDDEDESRSRRRRRRPRELLPLPPSHVACFRRPLSFPMDLAASPGGDKIVAATTDGHIMVYDSTRSEYTYDHDFRCWKAWPVLLALSSRPSSGAAAERRRRRDDGMSMLVATELLDLSEPDPYFEALRLTSGGRLQPLPVPPPLLLGDGDEIQVTSYFVAGRRVWLCVRCDRVKGTYSLDMAAPNLGWRREGSWVLPLEGRAVYAPDLGLLFGFKYRQQALRAIDIKARPRPVIRHEWTKATLLPSEDEGYSRKQDYLPFGSLAYLGRGRFCISWSSALWDERMILALTAVEVTMTNKEEGPPELLLHKRRSRCYSLPPDSQIATVLPVL